MWVVGDRVRETTSTAGTGDVGLLGAVSGFQAFSALAANGDLLYYAIVHQSAAEWEVGFGTWVTGNTLQRTKVLASSNAGALVSFSAGTKDVFLDFPGAQGLAPAIRRTVTGADLVVPPGASVYVSRSLTIASGRKADVRPGAVLEIG